MGLGIKLTGYRISPSSVSRVCDQDTSVALTKRSSFKISRLDYRAFPGDPFTKPSKNEERSQKCSSILESRPPFSVTKTLLNTLKDSRRFLKDLQDKDQSRVFQLKENSSREDRDTNENTNSLHEHPTTNTRGERGRAVWTECPCGTTVRWRSTGTGCRLTSHSVLNR